MISKLLYFLLIYVIKQNIMENIVIPITLDDIKEDKFKYIVSKLKELDYVSTKELYEFKQNFFNKYGSNVLLTINQDLLLKSHSFKSNEIKNIEVSNEVVSPSTIYLKKPPSGLKLNFDKEKCSSYFKNAFDNTSPINSDSDLKHTKNSESIEESITQDIDDINSLYSHTKEMMLKLIAKKKPFQDCTLKKYGKGFLLIPHSDHPDFGTKYYDNGVGDTGWWMPKKNGWFFKKDYIDPIIAGGAKLV